MTLKPDVEIKLIMVKADSFMMGSENGYDYEKPVHKVTLTEDFWLGETEITQAQYEAVMGRNPYSVGSLSKSQNFSQIMSSRFRRRRSGSMRRVAATSPKDTNTAEATIWIRWAGTTRIPAKIGCMTRTGNWII